MLQMVYYAKLEESKFLPGAVVPTPCDRQFVHMLLDKTPVTLVHIYGTFHFSDLNKVISFCNIRYM